jgi:hypothetical protein
MIVNATQSNSFALTVALTVQMKQWHPWVYDDYPPIHHNCFDEVFFIALLLVATACSLEIINAQSILLARGGLRIKSCYNNIILF